MYLPFNSSTNTSLYVLFCIPYIDEEIWDQGNFSSSHRLYWQTQDLNLGTWEPTPAESVFARLHCLDVFPQFRRVGASKHRQCNKDVASLKRNRRTSGKISLGRYFKSTRTDGVLSADEFRLIEFYDSFTWRGLLTTCGWIPGCLLYTSDAADEVCRV